ncbi:MAG: hypothetical protein E7515_03070 [Ruminococcaceae bacterium]|nr:hypothetical protein [Oscillospiraceae bacterium]
MYSEQDLKYASELREEIHREALNKAKALHPEIDSVVDSHPVEDYFQEHWDYPGQWYTVVAIPYGYKSRAAFVEELAKNTVENYLKNMGGETNESFYELISDYPDCVIDFCIVRLDEKYNSVESHFNALIKGAQRITGQLNVKEGNLKANRIPTETLFAPADRNAELNYRTAFLYPPHENNYTNEDFEKINKALFPNGTDCLEVFKWSTDWSDYFDDGHEWWGALCLSVYDKTLERFVIIMASATD